MSETNSSVCTRIASADEPLGTTGDRLHTGKCLGRALRRHNLHMLRAIDEVAGQLRIIPCQFRSLHVQAQFWRVELRSVNS